MRKLALIPALTLILVGCATAQQDAAGIPATKEDIQKLLTVMHSRAATNQMVDAMIKPLRKAQHEEYLKNKDKLPTDYEERMNRWIETNLKTLPWDEMIDAMIPAYQHHLTKGDVDSMIAFYSGPTGQKLLKNMPEIMAEAMESALPLIRKHVDRMTEEMHQESARLMHDSLLKKAKTEPTSN
jgi:hypothetical protein